MSPTTGLIPNHKGNPEVTRNVGFTVFVDYYYDLNCVKLMPKLDVEAAVESKMVLAFERVCDLY